MHAKRRERGQALTAPIQEKLDPFARFVEACIGLADAPAEDDSAYDLALDRARKAAAGWMRSMGWAPTETEAICARERQSGEELR